uniref:FecR domain-containing protein n=1 Tax=Pedobacter schmidteae TaxID=2201271 RepID=UPI000EB45806|nr:FecR domain-containing protein [Pedobacter schmidteae]
MTQDEKFRELITKYTEGTASPEELAWLESVYPKWNEELQRDHSDERLEEMGGMMWQNVSQRTGVIKPKAGKLWLRYAGIAAAVAAITFGTYFFFKAPRHLDTSLSSGAKAKDLNDIAPGGNKATLTSNGKTINLSDAKTGIDIDETTLTYNDGTEIDPSALGMTGKGSRTLQVTTPRGGTYQITLPDGTKVWLNAASKLEFPSNFGNKVQRIVNLKGEAYFEVSKNKSIPFIVTTDNQRVEVLGTHFNVNAYADEAAVKTTLLEGSVKVSSTLSSRAAVLKPNQQSVLANNKITVTQADINETMAWKYGDFLFKTEDFKTIMRKIARWYNVDIIYDKTAPENLALGGVVSRSKNISAVLKIMEATGDVHFKIEGRQITVSK